MSKHGHKVEKLVVESRGSDNLRAALGLAFAWSSRGALGYTTGPKGEGFLDLYAGDANGGQQFPAPLSPAEVQVVIEAWLRKLANNGSQSYPPGPDVDGSTEPGWRVTGPGQGSAPYGAICRIEPCWIVYSK